MRVGRPVQLHPDRIELRQHVGGIVAAEANDLGSLPLEFGKHLAVAALQRGGVDEEAADLVVGAVAGLLAERGGDHPQAGRNAGAVERIEHRDARVTPLRLASASKSEPLVGHERPLGPEQVLLDHRRQAADVIEVGVRDHQERHLEWRPVAEQLLELVGDRSNAPPAPDIRLVPAVDQDRDVAEHAEHAIAKFLPPHVEEVDRELRRIGIRTSHRQGSPPRPNDPTASARRPKR